MCPQKALVFTSLMYCYENLQSYFEKEQILSFFFYDVRSALQYIIREEPDYVFFDFLLPASRNMALRILKGKFYSNCKLILLLSKDEKILPIQIESVDHFFTLYSDWEDEKFVDEFNPFDYLPTQNRIYLEKDSTSWCYEVKTNSFYAGTFFYDVLDLDQCENKKIISYLSGLESVRNCRRRLITETKKSEFNGEVFAEDFYWKNSIFRIYGSCIRKQDFLFIVGSIREVQNLNGVGNKNGLKHGFVSLINHEFFTPLNAIKGFTSLLAMKSREKEYTRYIHQAVDELEMKFMRLYYLNMFYSNKLKIVKSPVIIISLINSLYSTFKFKLKEKQSLVVCNCEFCDDLIIESNYELLFNILVCLIENSIKYTQIGLIKLEVEKEDKDGNVRFIVTDCGGGFPDYLKCYLFDFFTQFDETMTRENGGLGLGLHFAACMTTVLNGEITVEKNQKGFMVNLIIPA